MGDRRDFEIVPHAGIGPIRFGMTRGEVRAAMGERPETFRGTANAPEEDAFLDRSFFVHYDDKDRSEFIEVATGPGVRYFYKGHDMFATKAEELVALIAEEAPFDPDDPELGYSYTFPKIDLALWRPVLPDDDLTKQDRIKYQFFESVGVGRPGYYAPT